MFAKTDKTVQELPVMYSKLTHAERFNVRLAYIEAQDRRCHYCKNLFTELPPEDVYNRKINVKLFPVNFFEYPIHLHHNHETDMTIGAVHCHCNAVLWQFHGE